MMFLSMPPKIKLLNRNNLNNAMCSKMKVIWSSKEVNQSCAVKFQKDSDPRLYLNPNPHKKDQYAEYVFTIRCSKRWPSSPTFYKHWHPIDRTENNDSIPRCRPAKLVMSKLSELSCPFSLAGCCNWSAALESSTLLSKPADIVQCPFVYDRLLCTQSQWNQV